MSLGKEQSFDQFHNWASESMYYTPKPNSRKIPSGDNGGITDITGSL
jgi:hypothetical protein